VPFSGGKPKAGGFVIDGGTKYTMPAGFVSLLTTHFFGLASKVETARLLATLPTLATASLARVAVGEWLGRDVTHPEVRRLLAALIRLATYADAPEQSAGAALENLKSAVAEGVLYLDGGWQTLVDGLRVAAEATGVVFETGAHVDVVRHDDRVRSVRLADGRDLGAAAVILCTGPHDAATLPEFGTTTPLGAWSAATRPVRAACLDVALSRLPVASATFGLGIDVPLYASVHSAAARLHPDGGAVVHVAKYLPADGSDAHDGVESELESMLDVLQPGWRTVVVARRFLPHLTVSNDLVTAARGGLAGRPGPAVPGIAGLYVAGDWIGGEGMLADASVASAAEAARLAARHQAAPIAA
jgi:phytoene dehydrogenase-like protein